MVKSKIATISILDGEGNIYYLTLSNNRKLEANLIFNRRICPGISMAEAQLFIALIEIFSTCHILPTSEDGLPDTDNAVNGGLTAPPAPYKAMFVKRTDIRT